MGKNLRDENLAVLIDVLDKSEVLEDLNLMCNQLTLADGKFAAAIAKNRTIKVLSLYQNSIGPEGAKHLAGALQTNSSLEQLFLEGNQIHDEGAKSIATAIRTNKKLNTLILRGNGIGNIGASALATSFLYNQTLRVVLLGQNNIGNEGGQALANAIEYNIIIGQLMLDANPMSDIMDLKIKTLLSRPSRKKPNAQKSSVPKAVVEELVELKDREIATKEAELVKNNEALTRMEAQLSVKNDEINLLKQLEIHVKEKEEEVKLLQHKISRRDEKLKQRMAEIVKLHEVLQTKDHVIATMKARSPLDVLAQFMQSKDGEIAELKATIENMELRVLAEDDVEECEEEEEGLGVVEIEESDVSVESSSEPSPREESEEEDAAYVNVKSLRVKAILKSNIAVQHEKNKSGCGSVRSPPKKVVAAARE